MDETIPVNVATLRAWMVRYITGVLDLPRDVSTAQAFNEYGFNSVEAVVMAGVMEEEFGVPIDPIRLFEHPSIEKFAAAMTGGERAQAAFASDGPA